MPFFKQNLGLFFEKIRNFRKLSKISQWIKNPHRRVIFPKNPILTKLEGGKCPGASRVSFYKFCQK